MLDGQIKYRWCREGGWDGRDPVCEGEGFFLKYDLEEHTFISEPFMMSINNYVLFTL